MQRQEWMLSYRRKKLGPEHHDILTNLGAPLPGVSPSDFGAGSTDASSPRSYRPRAVRPPGWIRDRQLKGI